jgi:cysteinyl-tRNA synthetase
MIAGARVEVAPYKKNPHDFVLWKPSKEGEPSWPSPWGQGRPGWHIECSAMIEETLGLPIDIHGGGIDLVFPHHENEIAQGVCAHGHAHEPNAHAEYSRYWMHNGFLTVDAEKMSKSIGNVLLLHDLVQNIPGEVVRWALLSAHYRQPLDWNQSLLDQSRKALDRLYGALHRAASVEAHGDEPPEDFLRAIEDDINTPGAMATLFALSSEIERAMTAGDHGVVARAKGELLAAAAILGVLQADPAGWLEGEVSDDLRTEVEALLEQRAVARAGKDWPQADRIRDRLNALDVVVMDGPSGATWRVKG